MRLLTALIVMTSLYNGQAISQESQSLQPQFSTSQTRLDPGDLTGITRLLFLTTTDFPPFNYINDQGELSGYNIDLVRALCFELKLQNICQIEALPWNELQSALNKGEGDALIGGLIPSIENRELYSFSQPYLRLPARFIALKSVNPNIALTKNDLQKPVGTLLNSKHAQIFRAYFPNLDMKGFDDRSSMMKALEANEISAIFDDALSLSFLLENNDNHACCHFIGEPYYPPQLTANQLSIAVHQNNKRLTRAFNYALSELERKGTINEIYLRHFPLGFY